MSLVLLVALLVAQGSSYSDNDLVYSDWQPQAVELESSIQLPVSQDRKSLLVRQSAIENQNLLARAVVRLGIVVPAIVAYFKVFSYIFLTGNTATTVTASDITTVTDLSTTTALVTTTEIYIILTSAFVRAPAFVTRIGPCIGKRQRSMSVDNQFLKGWLLNISSLSSINRFFRFYERNRNRKWF